MAIFLTAIIVQLTVVSSGGFFSPFLILLHLYTLGSSFLLNLPASVSFLVFSLVILTANVWLNQHLLALSKDDPFSIVLYFISFIVIIPLAQLLNRNYYIKDVLSRILSENLHLGQQREESILRGLNELVLVTDKDLKLLSANQTAEKATNFPPGQIIGHSLLEVLPLKYQDGSRASVQTLSVPQALEDKTARIIDGFYLDQPGTSATPITIQMRPIVDLKGKVNQLVFVIKERQSGDVWSDTHGDLALAHKKHQLIFEEFQKLISQSKLDSLKLKAEILRKIEEDLLIAQEIEDHPVKENVSYTDVAEVCKISLGERQEFAKSLNVTVQFKLPSGEVSELSLLALKDQHVQEQVLSGVSDFAVPVDPKWLQIIVEKLLDMAILLASEQSLGQVQVLVTRDDKSINVAIISSHPAIPDKSQKELLVQYFGKLQATTNLRLGSSLEGFIAQTIANQLKIPLTVGSLQYPSRLTFLLELPKNRH